MNVEEAREVLAVSSDTSDQKEAVDTLYSIAIERDEMARQADFWYNESLKTERTKDLISRKVIFFVTAAAFHAGAAFMYFIA